MSKRSESFKNSKLQQSFNDYKFFLFEKLAEMVGMKSVELMNFITDNYKEGKFELVSKNKLNQCDKSLSEAFIAGEKKEHERHLKAEDDAFERGKNYGAEQKENELRAKYDFVEKLNDQEKSSVNVKQKHDQDVSDLFKEFHKLIDQNSLFKF